MILFFSYSHSFVITLNHSRKNVFIVAFFLRISKFFSPFRAACSHMTMMTLAFLRENVFRTWTSQYTQAHRLSVLLIDYHFYQDGKTKTSGITQSGLIIYDFDVISGNILASHNSFQQLKYFSPINRRAIRDMYELWRWKKKFSSSSKNFIIFFLSLIIYFMFGFKKRLKKGMIHILYFIFPSVSSKLKLMKTQHCMLRAFIVINIFFLLFTFGGRSGLKHFNCIFRRLTTFMPQSPFNSFACFHIFLPRIICHYSVSMFYRWGDFIIHENVFVSLKLCQGFSVRFRS